MSDISSQISEIVIARNNMKSVLERKGLSPNYDIRTYSTEISSIPSVNNQNKTIEQNGVYQADQGYSGFGTVTVNVSAVVTYNTLFTIADSIYNPDELPNDSATVDFTEDDENTCLQKALYILDGKVW